MKKLPKSLSQETLEKLPFPEDITLGEIKAGFDRNKTAISLREKLAVSLAREIGGFRIRFVDLNIEDLPDELTLGAFRVLAAAKQASIIIDDDRGGMKTRQPDLVLT